MSFDDLLISAATVKRFTEGAPDPYGNPVKTWPIHLADEPCRLMATAGREIKVGAEVVVANYRLFIGDVDITEQDRVVIDSVTYEVLLVARKQDSAGDHHLECDMVTVR